MKPIYDKLQSIDFIIVIVYLLLLIIIGYRASFGKKKKDETLFMAGNSLRWHNIGFNMWGTNVGPSSLLAFASIGYTTGIVGANFEWYAFLFLLLLAMVFAPRYIASKVRPCPSIWANVTGTARKTSWPGMHLLKYWCRGCRWVYFLAGYW